MNEIISSLYCSEVKVRSLRWSRWGKRGENRNEQIAVMTEVEFNVKHYPVIQFDHAGNLF